MQQNCIILENSQYRNRVCENDLHKIIRFSCLRYTILGWIAFQLTITVLLVLFKGKGRVLHKMGRHLSIKLRKLNFLLSLMCTFQSMDSETNLTYDVNKFAKQTIPCSKSIQVNIKFAVNVALCAQSQIRQLPAMKLIRFVLIYCRTYGQTDC